MLQDFEKMKEKVLELEKTLLKVRPHSLTHLDRALSDTFPPLHYFEGDGDIGDDDVTSLNGSLLHGLREIEEKTAAEAERVDGGSAGEGAGLPIGGDLPTEVAGIPEEAEGEVEGVRGLTELAELESRSTGGEGSTGANGETLEKNDCQTNENSDLRDAVPCTFNAAPCSNIPPTYATAVSKPFHAVLKGPSAIPKGPDSIPKNHQSRLPQTTTATVIPTATVTMDVHSNNHCGNEEHEKSHDSSPNNDHHMEMQNTTTEDTKPINEFQTGSENQLDRPGNLTAQLSDVLGEGLVALATAAPAGWAEWSEAVELCTPRSNSSLSVKSSGSSGEAYMYMYM